MRISDWSSDVCSSDLLHRNRRPRCRSKAYSQRSCVFPSSLDSGRQCGDLCGRQYEPVGIEAVAREELRSLAHDARHEGQEEFRCSHACCAAAHHRSEEHTSELQSLMRISYAVFCVKKKKNK